MQSKTSFFNPTVFWSDQRHYWPLTAGYTLFWLLALPLSRFTDLNFDRKLSVWNMQFDTLDLAAHAGYWSMLFFGVMFAMAAFAYLTNPRATNGLHALPARRETLYVTHYVAGLCAQLAAQLVAVLLTGAVLASHRAFDARTLGLSLLALVLPTVFFYSFGVFCMMFTGQILAAPVFYGVLNVLVVGVEMLLRTLAGNFLFGWAGDSAPTLTALSPIAKLVQLDVAARHDRFIAGEPIILQGLDWLLLYAAVGLVFAALGLLVYRKRDSEATGSTVAVAWAKPIFQYGVAFCAALALGQLLYSLFFGQYRSNGNYSLPGMLVCMAAAGIVGFFVAEMLLKKSFRVWRSGWKGAVCVAAVLVILGVGMSFDLTGYEGYVPDADEVMYVSVEWMGWDGDNDFHAVLKSEDAIRLATEAHGAVVRDKQRQQKLMREPGGNEYLTTQPDGAGRVELSETRGYLSFYYMLRSGRTVRRSYYGVRFFAAELNDPDSTAATLSRLYGARSVALHRALGTGYDNAVDPGTIEGLRFTGGYVDASRWVEENVYLGEQTFDLSPAQARAVYEAIVRDVEQGHISDSIFDASVRRIVGSVELYAKYAESPAAVPGAEARYDADLHYYPNVTNTMTETLAVLRDVGAEFNFNDYGY